MDQNLMCIVYDRMYSVETSTHTINADFAYNIGNFWLCVVKVKVSHCCMSYLEQKLILYTDYKIDMFIAI